jgi:hypothetical protein
MGNPTPLGSQHAKRSISMRCRGGKPLRAAGAGGVEDGVEAAFFVAATQPPDARAGDLETLGQGLDHHCRVGHSEQNPRAPGGPLLGAAVVDKVGEIGRVGRRELDEVGWSAPHER